MAKRKPQSKPATKSAVRPAPKSATKPPPAGSTDAELNRELLYSMLLQRRFEERTAEAYAVGKIGGFCHLYIGQEAVSTGSISLLRPDDYIITTYRDHGQALARGMTPRALMAELFGRADGCSGGKGGSMHLFDRNLNFLGGHGIVGGHIPIATGVGFAIKYRGGDQVIVCFMGEAAVNGGAFHEALNMAALWKLPVIFVIENNRYGMGTAVERASAINDIYERAGSYDMARGVVDGQDVFAVRAAMAEAVERARVEQAPTLLEIRTYRFMGHSMSDAVSGTYRSKAELDEHMKRDPIVLLRTHMEEAGEIDEAALTRMDEEIKAICQDSWDFADQSPEPPLEALYEDVLVDTTSDAVAEAEAAA
ncbi:MAG TPA: pyruvate dehydrogenase (acetyl-transferring) E1 component subunit alpha [Gemmatimonadaceae bacterium]|jgi:pyruvate dehydrogenase E1 component alpha subunit|nr:pyruvate dehydrogenase (acetyl-transferring) E1 component subunit alpha [Gemmatimonadaceae bacterium]